MFNVNVKTTWNIYRAAIPAIRQTCAGALVGIASAAGLRGSAQMAAYSATKSAVMRLTESLADEIRWRRHPSQRRFADND
jgi:short-subunit dehydrogenase